MRRVSAPAEAAGDWHTKCLRAAGIGKVWQTARVRNFCDVRGYEVVGTPSDWEVLKHPRSGELVAFSSSGEMIDLSQHHAGTYREGVFHLDLGDRRFAAGMQEALRSTGSFPLARVLAHFEIANKMAEPEAVEGALR